MVKALEHISTLSAYTPGASVEDIKKEFGLLEIEKLASNENPLGCSPLALEAAIASLNCISTYNDGGQALRKALADFYHCNPDRILVNSGSDAIIHQIMRTFLGANATAVSSVGGFVSFGIAVQAAGSRAVLTPMTDDYRFDVEALANAVTSDTRVVYIPNPNNPTGTYVTEEEFEWFVRQVPEDVLIVMDEAYFEYASTFEEEQYPDSTRYEHKNVITLRTFSKAYGLAGFRVGYAIGDPAVIAMLTKTKLPFSPNGPGCAAALVSLKDHDFVRRSVNENKAGLRILTEAATEVGLKISKSIANFIMIDCEEAEAADRMHLRLLNAGFISRPLIGFGLPGCLRISTGTVEQCQRLSAILKSLTEQFEQH